MNIKKFIVFIAISLLTFLPAQAQAASRNVTLTWGASITTNVTGYTIYRGTTNTGPWTQIGTVSGISTTSYVDATAVVGSTYFYAVAAVAPACTSTTPPTTPCGSSAFALSASVPVPTAPAFGTSVTVIIP